MRGSYEFPNGRKVIVTGFRGKKYSLTPNKYDMILFKCTTEDSGHVLTAEFGYRGNFWTMNAFGKVYRVAHGKMVTLCDLATVTTNIHPE